MSLVSERIAAIRRSGFLRAVWLLVGGASFAHAITALTLPILTRLYSPLDFSLLAVFTGVVATAAVAACLRFDVAVPLPDDDGQAINVLALGLIACLAISGLIGLLLLALGAAAVDFGQPALAPFLWLVPFGVFLMGAFSALQNWFIRRKGFASIAAARIGQSTAASAAQVTLGAAGVGPAGLIVGQMINSGAGCVGLLVRFLRTDRGLLRSIDRGGLKAAWRRYERFPRLSAMEALFNSAGMQVPIIMIAVLAVGADAGFLSLAMFVMQAPMGLIGNAVSQVYVSRAPDADRRGQLGPLTANVLGGLFRSGVGPLIFAGIVSPDVFQVIFGHEWRRAGELVTWMTPWFVLQFLATPISMVLHVKGRLGAALSLQFGGLVLRVTAVYLMAMISAAHVAEAYSVSGFAFYACCLALAVRISGVAARDFLGGFRAALPTVAGWIIGGLIVRLLGGAVQLLTG